jgi:shikimate dehydrogenase
MNSATAILKKIGSVSNPTMLFIGVTTSKSFVHNVFPKWITLMGKKAELMGVDLALNSPPDLYRDVVDSMRNNGSILGALVTSHKTNIYEHSIDLFHDIDLSSRFLHEVGVIYKNNDRLACGATDPDAQQRVLQKIFPNDYWKNCDAHVMIMGAGGAGVALAYTLLSKRDNIPSRVIMTDIREDRIALAKQILGNMCEAKLSTLLVKTAHENDRLLELLPPGSLIVNATGMGKDTPGSPVSDAAHFPAGSIVWEFNYRGNLVFLDIAKKQEFNQRLTLEDGWRYFIYGWCFVMGKVFNVTPTQKIVDGYFYEADKERVRAG